MPDTHIVKLMVAIVAAVHIVVMRPVTLRTNGSGTV